MEHRLRMPLTAEAIQAIHAGDTVLLSGTILTGRDAAHKLLMKLLDEGSPLPYDLEGTAVYYSGPCPAPPGLPIGSCGPTTSSRMDAYAPRLIALGQRVMIGKGPRARAVIDAILAHRGLYLAATGGAGALYARCVKASRVIAFPELGAEAVHELTVEDMPLIAAIDCHGGNLYDSGPEEYRIPPSPAGGTPLAQSQDGSSQANRVMPRHDQPARMQAEVCAGIFAFVKNKGGGERSIQTIRGGSYVNRPLLQ